MELEHISVIGDETLDKLDRTAIVNGAVWLPGSGSKPCDIMFIGESPRREEIKSRDMLKGSSANMLLQELRDAGIPRDKCYFTNLVKFYLRDKVKERDKKPGMPLLMQEIEDCSPRFIIPMGANALKSVTGRGYKFTDYRGAILDHPDKEGVKVVPIYSPAYIMRFPDDKLKWSADIRMISRIWRGEPAYKPCPPFKVINTPDEMDAMVIDYLQRPPVVVMLDCEWHGENWMNSKRWIRTIQLGFITPDDRNFVIRLRDEKGQVVQSTEDRKRMITALRKLLRSKNTNIIGHNVRADGHWLASEGIDIRGTTVADTMINEHTIDSRGPFGLEELTMKYTDYGRYDKELSDWKRENPSMCTDGYGFVPDDILLPYGVMDVVAPKEILRKQHSGLKPYRAKRGKYPSLAEASFRMANILYEPERVGLLLDRGMFDRMYNMYSDTRSDMLAAVKAGAKRHAMPDFNPRSVHDVRELLFGKLKMTPIKTTKAFGSKPWSWLSDQGEDIQDEADAATDKDTLAILADTPGADKVVGLIRDFRKVDYVCNQWLVHPDIAAKFGTDARGGGLLAKVWPDGRLHASFSQLKETARLGSARPNVQNWMKQAEGELKRIVGEERMSRYFDAFPTLRSMIIPTPGHVFIEADWKQAEMFVLAWLSGDKYMRKTLTTPGADMHDNTAIGSFRLNVLWKDGTPCDTEFLLRLALRDLNKYGTVEGHEFEKVQKTLIYEDQRGRRLSRKEFKDSIRVGAKSLNFGIPYGRGVTAIALQIKAQTGTTRLLPEIEAEVAVMMEAWKKELYVDAWDYMMECSASVVEQGYVENPWGRKRLFAQTSDKTLIRAFGREAQNFPIQSTVADTCIITLCELVDYRKRNNLHFRIVNQVHDAIILETPENEIEQTKNALRETMGNIEIPIPGDPLTLDIDIDVMSRWGVKAA